MRHSSRFKIVVACFSCYILGDFLGELFLLQNNKAAMILVVMIPTILLLCYISMVVHSTQPPRKKKLPVRRASRISKPRNLKAVR